MQETHVGQKLPMLENKDAYDDYMVNAEAEIMRENIAYKVEEFKASERESQVLENGHL